MIQILYSHIAEKNHSFLLKELLPELPKGFQEKVLRYRRWQDAQLSLLGRLLLKHGLKNKYTNEFNDEGKLYYTSYNKPYFRDQNVKFNISHSGNIVVCAITKQCEIGIDIEIVENIKVEDFKNQMTPREWYRIISSNAIESSFFNYWTQKEAVIKAHGMGLSIPLKSFEIINNHAKVNEEDFYLKEIQINDRYKCHVACKNKINSVDLDVLKIDVFEFAHKIAENNLIAHDYL